MTDRQKLLAALVSKPDSRAEAARLSVFEVAAMLERLRADLPEEALAG
jgi:hypothetical protein